jgi:hypothetical protein
MSPQHIQPRLIFRQLQKMSDDGDETSEQWTAEMKVLRELVEPVHATISGRTSSLKTPASRPGFSFRGCQA